MTRLYEFVYRLKDRVSGTLAKINAAQEKVRGGFRKTGETGDNAFNRMSSGALRFRSILGSLRGIVAGLGITFGAVFAVQAVKGIINLGAEAEQTKIAFETMLGSVERGNKLFSDIQNLASATPLTSRALQQNAQTLLGFNAVAEDKVIPTLQMLGDIARGDQNRLQQLTLAFSQMRSAGRLMGQDLLQMINAGFNPLREISAMTGRSIGQLKKDMESGAISADMVTRAFERATQEGGMFFNMMQKQSQTTSGRISTFVDKFQLRMMKVGEVLNKHVVNPIVEFGIEFIDKVSVLKPAIMGLLNAFQPLIGAFRQFSGQGSAAETMITFLHNAIVTITPAVQMFANIMASIVTWVGKNIELVKTLGVAILGGVAAFKLLTTVIGIAKAAMLVLNAVMAANPIGLVITLIGALVGAFIYLWNTSEKFRGFLTGLWESVKTIFKGIWEAGKQYLGGLGDLLVGIFTLDMDRIKKGLSGVFNAQMAAYKTGAKAGESYKKGFEKGVENFRAGKKQTSLFDQVSAAGVTGAAGAGGGGGAAGAGGTPEAVQDGIDNISGGGRRPQNITINLGKLQDEINIHTTTVGESAAEMERMITEALLRVLNSANYAAD